MIILTSGQHIFIDNIIEYSCNAKNCIGKAVRFAHKVFDSLNQLICPVMFAIFFDRKKMKWM